MSVEIVLNHILQREKLRLERGPELSEVTQLVSWKSWNSLWGLWVSNLQIVSTIVPCGWTLQLSPLIPPSPMIPDVHTLMVIPSGSLQEAGDWLGGWGPLVIQGC